MRRILFILACLLTVALFADDSYIDDVYYYPSLTTQDATSQPLKPYYDTKNIKEFVFVDTVTVNTLDTVQPMQNTASPISE